MSDLIERLREASRDYVDCGPHCDLELEAADEIERLEARVMNAGRCRFNCRTAKENQEAAWLAARARDESNQPIYGSFEEYWTTEGRHETSTGTR